MTLRPLPKTVVPVPDELLSGWLIRLATINYCEVDELLAHIGISVRHPAAFDFEVDMATLEKIAIAARLDPKTVGSLVFPPMSQAEALLTAQFPFQSCPDCSRQGLALRHWRRAWAFDCQICGTRLLSIFAIPHGELASEKLLHRARRGAGHLELAIASNSAAHLRRAMRAVTCMRRLCPIDVSLAVARLVALAIGSFGCQNSYELTGESRMRSFSWN